MHLYVSRILLAIVIAYSVAEISAEQPLLDQKNECAWPASLDAVVAAPENHRILFENERVRVLDVLVPANTKEAIHAHCWPSVLYVLQEGDYVDYDQSGKIIFDSRKTDTPAVPYVEWLDPQAPHTVENLDNDKPLHLIRVELK